MNPSEALWIVFLTLATTLVGVYFSIPLLLAPINELLANRLRADIKKALDDYHEERVAPMIALIGSCTPPPVVTYTRTNLGDVPLDVTHVPERKVVPFDEPHRPRSAVDQVKLDELAMMLKRTQ